MALDMAGHRRLSGPSREPDLDHSPPTKQSVPGNPPTFPRTTHLSGPKASTQKVRDQYIGTAEDLAAVSTDHQVRPTMDIIVRWAPHHRKGRRDEEFCSNIGYKTTASYLAGAVRSSTMSEPSEVSASVYAVAALVLQKEDKERRLIMSKKRAPVRARRGKRAEACRGGRAYGHRDRGGQGG